MDKMTGDGHTLKGRCLIFDRAEADHEILTSSSATLVFSVLSTDEWRLTDVFLARSLQ